MKEMVSVVISAYNGELTLPRLLASVRSQTYPRVEVIVIDDSSQDNTAKVCKAFGTKVYIRPHQERSVQRNFGAKIAKGGYLLFLDADMELSSDVVNSCVNLAQKNNWDALIIPEKSFGSNYWAKAKALERNCYIGDKKIEAARFIKNEAFKRVRGYDSKMIAGEDWDLHRRLLVAGYKIGRTNRLIVHHEGHLSFFGVLRKKLYYAQHADEYIKKNVLSIRDVIEFIIRPSIFKNWRFLLADPIHVPGLFLLLWGEMLVGGVGAILKKPIFIKRALRI